ncbi:MAG: hypothetical protein LWY06_02305 [Firmicutes bacterium]|nr:hypothetical protein [Bacillota bacterium]
MAHAYTPGLQVVEQMVLRKERRLPLKGRVEVKVGDEVKSDTIVARTELPGNPELVNVANKLGVEASEVPKSIKKKLNEFINKDEVLAQSKSFFGLFTNTCLSPISGTVEHISDTTGKVLVRAPAIPVQVKAYIDGKVVEVMHEEGVVVESFGTYIQGIFGVGGEEVGELMAITDDPDAIITPDKITSAHKGKVLLGGALVPIDTIHAAIKAGVIGFISGGFDDADLRKFLGYDLGVAITGSEELGLTLVVTEGFGKIRMADKTFNLLKKRVGRKASINGATQIRAGVIRPEILISTPEIVDKIETENATHSAMQIGSTVRIIREPRFGELAKVVNLPVSLMQVQSETKVRVVDIEFRDGTKWTLPRANVEII